MRNLLLAFAMAVLPCMAEPVEPADSPFKAPEALVVFARRVTFQQPSHPAKARELLRAMFAPEKEGGLDITYDNTYTRTVEEVWKERKANCLSLTALYVSACRSVGIEAGFAESPSIAQWRRAGSLIRKEIHVVAVIRQLPLSDLVADFLPEMRKGFYLTLPMPESRARAFFYSNRAVERLEQGDVDGAQVLVRRGIQEDGSCSAVWNIMGVICQYQKNPQAAERAFHQALRVDGTDGIAMGNLEGLYRAQGEHLLAMEFRRRSAQARAKDPYFHAFQAQECMDAGDYDKALGLLDKAIALQRREPEFYLQLFRLHQLRGRKDDAAAALQKGQKYMDPEEQARFASKLARL